MTILGKKIFYKSKLDLIPISVLRKKNFGKIFPREVMDKIVFSSLIAINGTLTSHCDNLSTHHHVTYHHCFDTSQPDHATTFLCVATSSRKKRKRSNCPFVPKRAVKRKTILTRIGLTNWTIIGRGHAAASKAFSFAGLKPINDSYWTDHTKRIEEEVNKALQKELDEAAFEEKEFKFAAGEVNCSRDELPNVNVEAGVTIDAPWSSRGWSPTDAVVAAISVDTGTVVDVVHLCSSCTECKKIEQKRQDGQISRLECLLLSRMEIIAISITRAAQL